MWWLVLLAALVAGDNGFLWGLFVQVANEPEPVEVPVTPRVHFKTTLDLHRSEWRRL